jgi:hypothetical protein
MRMITEDAIEFEGNSDTGDILDIGKGTGVPVSSINICFGLTRPSKLLSILPILFHSMLKLRIACQYDIIIN